MKAVDTSLATELKAQALALANARMQANDQLAGLREQARAHLEQIDFPHRKTERWKYTSLHKLKDGHLTNAANGPAQTELPDFNMPRLVFINGVFEESLSTLPDDEALEVVRLNGDNAVPLSEEPLSPFAWLNGAAVQDGLCLRIKKGQRAEPIHVVFAASGDEPSCCQARLRVELGEQSEASVIEHYTGQGPVLTNAVTEISAAPASRLVHYRLQDEKADSLHVGTVVIEQQRDSHVESYQLMAGNQLRRNDIQAILKEPGANLELNGAFIGRERAHIDNQINVEHRAPHCTSHQLYKGMAGDKARLVFNGRIHIHPGAEGTSADLSNKNLLLSNGAEIDTKPELEIYNDDVTCSHGTTVGQMDPLEMFYLQSRGIRYEQARRMLGIGFINELLLALPEQTIAEWARPWLAEEVTEAE
jgi:Fe-S cluster assembly protein SufD